MKTKKPTDNHNLGYLAAAIAFLASYGFFQFAYPYHLMRREQMSLFVYDGDYIRQTYCEAGGFVRFVSDFLEQFFHLPVVGPVVIALLLTAIGAVTYRICRKLLGQWPSLAIATLMFAWSFMRETGNLYVTRYTLVVLGYLSFVLLALQFRKGWAKAAALAVFAAIGIYALGSPVHKNYGKAWGVPKLEYDRVIGLDDQVARENWDKVLKLSEKDLYMVEASYCYNLAHAMKGDLADTMYDHSQAGPYSFILHVIANQSTFTNCLAGELWYQLGCMTIAEQSAITALQASPNHTGSRFIKRLANVNLITCEDADAQKYLNLLSKTLFYGKWARSMMPGNQDEATRAYFLDRKSKLAFTDFVHLSDSPRDVLLGILEADPDNLPARNYLLCYDLVRYDLDEFISDYSENMIDGRIYKEAVLIWLGREDMINDSTVAEYNVDPALVKKMDTFFRMPDRYRNTYWYQYLQALNKYGE